MNALAILALIGDLYDQIAAHRNENAELAETVSGLREENGRLQAAVAAKTP